MSLRQIKAILIVLIFSFSNAAKYSFSSSSFKETADHIVNPGQGFYKAMFVYMKPDSFEPKKEKTEQVYHLRCDISAFSKAVNGKEDKELTDTVLDGLNDFLKDIRKENKNAVIRFAYDPHYDGHRDKEPSMSMMKSHIKALSKVLNKHKDVLIAIEAGMIGLWGEMNGSKIVKDGSSQKEENRAKIVKYWLEYTKEIPILARYPRTIYQYFGKSYEEMLDFKIHSDDPGYRIGIFNDCYLSSDTDVGTYRDDRSTEMKFLSKINEHVPYGGETCAVDKMNDLKNAIPEMYKLKLNYLNKGHKHDVTEKKWVEQKYSSSIGSDKIFYGLTGFEYIKRHLGYRFVIKSISVDYEKYGSYKMNIKLKNVGFGNLLKNKKMDIIFTDKNDKDIKR